MVSDESRSEAYLRGIIELLHGVELQPFDCDGRQRAVDYIFSSPEGVTGAVEMTTYRDGSAAALQAKLNNDGGTIPVDSSRGWLVQVERSTKLDRLQSRLRPLIAACDRHGVDDPVLLPADEHNVDVQWFVSSELGLSPSGLAAPGIMIVQLPPVAGWPRLENLDQDLDRMLTDKLVVSKLNKLHDHHDVTERHLAVGVDLYRAGFELVNQLLSPRGYVPEYVLPEDFAATHLWITAGFGPVLAWTRSSGWAWTPLFQSM